MPCTSEGYPTEPERRHGLTINQLDAVLCLLFQRLEENGKLDEYLKRAKAVSGVPKAEILLWWDSHQEVDRARAERERAEREQAQLVEQAKSKLSVPEIRALKEDMRRKL